MQRRSVKQVNCFSTNFEHETSSWNFPFFCFFVSSYKFYVFFLFCFFLHFSDFICRTLIFQQILCPSLNYYKSPLIKPLDFYTVSNRTVLSDFKIISLSQKHITTLTLILKQSHIKQMYKNKTEYIYTNSKLFITMKNTF